MAQSASPIVNALNPTLLNTINWLLIVLCIVIVLVTAFFLFYWNRLLGWVLAMLLRAIFWKRNNIWIECDAVQVSLLGGRIMIKGLHYHSTNQSIRVVECHITWRYWYLRTRGEVGGKENRRATESGRSTDEDLPCRVKVVAKGLEWFLYNRTPAFDAILKEMNPSLSSSPPSTTPLKTRVTPPSPTQRATHPPKGIRFSRRIQQWARAQVPSLELQDLLPIGVEVSRGAIVLGNDSIPSIFIAQFKTADGTIATTRSRSELDVHKQTYSFRFQETKIYTRVNRDYSAMLIERGQAIEAEIRRKASMPTATSPANFVFRVFHDLAPRFLVGLSQGPPPQPSAKWHGLSRYYTVQDTQDQDTVHEYAKLSTLLETPILELTYYSDTAGVVPAHLRGTNVSETEIIDVGNGDLSPEWGIDFVLHGGQINYGPWADRQRRALQTVFTPSSYYNRTPTERLQPGQTRMHVAMNIFLKLQGEVTLRIPLREYSKNWRYDAKGDLGPSKRGTRPFGWLDLKIGANSTFLYNMSMVADERGFNSSFELYTSQLRVLSSVNQNPFMSIQSCRATGVMPSPLVWNSSRTWSFNITLHRPTIHLLRDHVTLMTDLAKDWTAGPTAPQFIPVAYLLTVTLKDFSVKLSLNDHNIIDFPLDDAQNTILTLTGPNLLISSQISSIKYRPLSTTVPILIEAPAVELNLTLPTWNTNSVLATARTKSLGRIDHVQVNSSLTYFTDVRPDNVDVLRLNILTRGVLFRCPGWAIRHLMLLRDNYFGNFTNFTTRHEYFVKRATNTVGDPVDIKYREDKSNMFQVSLVVDVEDAAILLPQEVHDFTSAVLVHVPSLQIVLGLHDYFMEMNLNTHPLRLSALRNCENISKMEHLPPKSEANLIINGIDIVANRLFGPQPRTSTYLCIWEFRIGSVHGSVSPELLSSILASTASLTVNFKDAMNAPAEEYEVAADPDVTFLQLHLQSVDMMWRTSRVAVRVSLPNGLQFNANDLAGHRYKNVKTLRVPKAQIQCLLAPADEPSSNEYIEVATATLDCFADIYSAPRDWHNGAAQQLLFISSQDTPTRRASFLNETVQSGPPQLQSLRRDHELLLPAITVPPSTTQQKPESWYSSSESSFSISELSMPSSDDGLSPRERDEKLAQSWTSMRLHRVQSRRSLDHSTDEVISSGDESDEADETSVAGSDTENRSEGQRHTTGYRTLLRTYTLTKSGTFVLNSSGLRRNPLEPDLGEIKDNSPPPLNSTDPESSTADITILRIQSKRSNEFVITPLFTEAMQCIREGSVQKVTLEQQLDKLFVQFFSSYPSPSSSPSRVVFDARLASWRISFWQRIDIAVNPANIAISDPNLMSLATLSLGGGQCSGVSQENGTVHVYAAFNRVQAVVQTHTDDDVVSQAALLEIGTSAISMVKKTSGTSVASSVGDIRLITGEDSPSNIAATIMGGLDAAMKIANITREWRRELVRTQRVLLRNLLEHPRDEPIVADPMSWTQVSFMVKSGLPKALRSDPSLALLASLRRSSRSLSEANAEKMLKPDTKCMPKLALLSAIIGLVRARSGEGLLDMSERDISQLHLIQQLFTHNLEESVTSSPPIVWALTTGRTVVSSGEEGAFGSEFVIGAVDLMLRHGIRSRLPAPPSNLDRSAASARSSINSLPQIFPDVTHIVLSGSVTAIKLSLLPTSLPFIRNLLRLTHSSPIKTSHHPAQCPAPHPTPHPTPYAPQDPPPRRETVFEVTLNVNELEVRASAQRLSVRTKMAGLRIMSQVVFHPSSSSPKPPMSPSFVGWFDEWILEARAIEPNRSSRDERAVLAAISATGAHLYVTSGGEKLICTCGLQSLKLGVPRSAMKLYNFIQEWNAEYLPTYHSMIRDIIAEMDDHSPKPITSENKARKSPFPINIDFQASVKLIGISLHIMPGTWLSWSFHHAMSFGSTPNLRTFTYGIQLAGQTIALSAKPDDHSAMIPTPSDSSIKLELPSFKCSGVVDQSFVKCTLIVERFKLMLKPQYFDDILAVQQKFGSDFNEILDLFAKNRSSRVRVTSHGEKPADPVKMPKYSLSFDATLKGFSIGLQGPTSIQYLESSLIHGIMRPSGGSSVEWRLEMTSLSLSLVHQGMVGVQHSTGTTDSPSASMVTNLVVHNAPGIHPDDEIQTLKHVVVQVNKIHALLMPAAIGELGDLIDHVQAEMLQRKEQRASELEEIKKKTQRVIQTFEGPPKSGIHSPFDNMIVSIDIRRIGIAFPLTLDKSVTDPSLRNSNANRDVPAFLFSIKSVEFVTRRSETGHAKMVDFAFQFVPSFNERNPSHFESKNHETLNRMLYPEMTAEIHSQTISSSRRVWVRAAVSGFELDVSPSLAQYIFSLVDVYRVGKENFERFAAQPPHPSHSTEHSVASPVSDTAYATLPTSDVRMTLDFRSGKVRFHRPDGTESSPHIPHWGLDPTLQDPLNNAEDIDTFHLPVVTVSVEYHATPASQKVASIMNPSHDTIAASSLIFIIIVHSSRNTLHPSLLPFLTEITHQVEDRLATISPMSRREARKPDIPQPASPPRVIRALELSVSLRIDKSDLNFTCLPDVNVVAGLHWESGGFILRVAPGAREIGLIGSIEGITTRLRHGYLVEDCVNAGAKNLTFNLAFTNVQNEEGYPINSVSLVVHTEIDGLVRFSRLQDVLCFKAVWLDRIAIFEGLANASPPSRSSTEPELTPSPSEVQVDQLEERKGFLTSILVRVEHIKLQVDLGQAITKLTLDLRPVVVRTRLTKSLSEISFHSGAVKLDAERALSGTILLPNLTFETVRRRKDMGHAQARLLELTIQTGGLDVSVNYEAKKILIMRGDPLQATVHDDWSQASPHAPAQDRQVQLHFAVRGGQIGASARIMTIPELILLGGRVTSLIRAQKDGAARESQAFRITQLPKPNNPLSSVATAMMQTARSKLKAEETPDVSVVQHMHLHVDGLRITIFNQADTRMTQFEAINIEGDLLRNVKTEHYPPFRDLNLALESFEVRGGDMPPSVDQWLDFHPGAKVFTMPEMNISMQSWEHIATKRLDYNFRSTFPRPKTKSINQTLYIALDFHKYEQLMAMQSMFKTEIEKALAEVAQLDKPFGAKIMFTTSTPRNARPSSPPSSSPSPSSPPPTSSSLSRTSITRSSNNLNPASTGSAPKSTGGTSTPTSSIPADTSLPPDITPVKIGIRGLIFHCKSREIETPKLHQLGAASPDLETFKQWTNISIRDSLPVWIHEYATVPIEGLMKVLLEVYIKQLKTDRKGSASRSASGSGGGGGANEAEAVLGEEVGME